LVTRHLVQAESPRFLRETSPRAKLDANSLDFNRLLRAVNKKAGIRPRPDARQLREDLTPSY